MLELIPLKVHPYMFIFVSIPMNNRFAMEQKPYGLFIVLLIFTLFFWLG